MNRSSVGTSLHGWRRLAVKAVGVGVFATPVAAHAGTYELCMLYHASTVDSGIGEDYYTSTPWWRARGAKVEIYRVTPTWPYPKVWPPPGQDPYIGKYDGCVTFDVPGVDQAQFVVRLYTETRLGENDNLVIRAWSPGATQTGYFSIVTSTLSSGETRWIYGPASTLSNLVAIASFAYYWWWIHDTAGQGIEDSQTVTLYDRECSLYPGNSCSGGTSVSIAPDHVNRKFAIAHEMGHSVYMLYRAEQGSDMGYPFDCSRNVGGPACEYTNGPPDLAHALQSMEWSSCAMSEGFAHFFATDAFNSHGQYGARFGYYKYLDLSDPYVVDVENGPLGGGTAFMEAACVPPYGGHGTELDWLRTFWDYHTNAGTKPGHSLILDEMWRAHEAMTKHCQGYRRMHESATSDGLGERWASFGAYNGIDWECSP